MTSRLSRGIRPKRQAFSINLFAYFIGFIIIAWLFVIITVPYLTTNPNSTNKLKINNINNNVNKINNINNNININKLNKYSDPYINYYLREYNVNLSSIIKINNNNKCPLKYPSSIVGLKDLPLICSNLAKFKILGGCDISNCSKCVPPNSETMPWANSDIEPWLEKYKSTTEKRRNLLKTYFNYLNPRMDGPIMIMVMNWGYAWLYLNWVCSINYNNINYIRNRTLIVVTDLKSYNLVKLTGFKVWYPDIFLGNDILKKIDERAPPSFALGAHRWTVSLQISTLNDYLHLGYDVIVQDLDIIWKNDPVKYLLTPKFQSIDIQMSVDGRMDNRGPGNSGFFIVRSNCKTKIFLNNMISLIGLVIVGRSDQILWNTLIQEKQFRMLHFETLDTNYFLSGFQVNIKKGTSETDLPNNGKDFFLFHASWTTDQFDKVEKFYNINHWYFNQNKCKKYFNKTLLPDLKDRKWHIRDKTKSQEKKLLKLGIVKDSTNGVYKRSD